MTYSPVDDNLIATCSTDTTVRVWYTGERTSLILTGHSANVSSVSFSPDGQFLVSTSEETTIRMWTIDGTGTDTDLGVLRGHTQTASSAAISPDNNFVASCSDDETNFATKMELGQRKLSVALRSVRF